MKSKKDHLIESSGEDQRFIPAALKWLYEMEALNSKQLINNLYINIYNQSRHINDVDLLIDKNNKKMLIYLEFDFIANFISDAQSKAPKNILNKVKMFIPSRVEETLEIKRIASNKILENLQELLPSFEFRIVEDKKIFDKALKLAKKATLGETENDEKFSSTDNDYNDEYSDES